VDDARFEDAAERPVRLLARDEDDLQVIAALTQDAVFPASEMTWDRRQRRFGVLLNRFRWEDAQKPARRKRPFERVQSVLVIEDATRVVTQGVDPRERDVVLSLLDIGFEPAAEGAGRVVMTLAGDGALGVDVEALEVKLKDVTRPYIAPSKKRPSHD